MCATCHAEICFLLPLSRKCVFQNSLSSALQFSPTFRSLIVISMSTTLRLTLSSKKKLEVQPYLASRPVDCDEPSNSQWLID